VATERKVRDLVVRVGYIKGFCPVYREGDMFTIKEGYRLNAREADSLCMHSLASLLPYYVALSQGADARELGLSRESARKAFLQCLDPCDFTGGGTVVFEIERT
jgi:uncharacterized repeat protein (TIGR04076 family)